MRLNIKQRFAVLFVCSAIVPLAVTTWGSFISARIVLDRFVEAELALVTQEALADLEALFDRMLSDLETWSGLRIMQDALIDDEAGEIAAELDRLRARYPYFRKLVAVNAEGTVIASTRRDELGDSLAGSEMLLATSAGASHHSRLAAGEDGAASVAFAVPLRASYDPSTIIGALVGVADWEQVCRRLAAFSFAGAMQDEDHALVLRSVSDGSVWYQTAGTPAFPLDEPRLWSAAYSHTAETGAGPYLLTRARSEVDGPDGVPEWEVFAAVGQDVATASVSRLGWQVLALVTVLSGAALLIARVAANDLVRPIVSLIAVMKRLADGHGDTRIPALGRSDEIGDMAHALSVFKEQAEERLRLMAEREASAARALDASEERFRDIAEAASDWIWETDAGLRWTYLSERFLDATGLRREALLGRSWTELLEAEGGSGGLERNAEVIARQPFRDFHCLIQGADGRRRHCRVSGKPLFDERGAFRGYRGATSDVTREVEAQARANHLALHDALTGLPNRTLLAERLDHALAGIRRSGGAVNVLCIDLDRFKEVNDTLGHPAGDGLLKAVAAELQENVREMDTVSRVGGDEFVVLQVATGGADGAEALCQRLLRSFARGFQVEGQHIATGLSIGVAIAPADGDGADDILKKADIALYQAKQEGRGVYRFFEPEMNARLQERRALESDLRAAIAGDAFTLHYQPQVEVSDGRVVGVEALLRWTHPVRGAVSPCEYIPIAEETGLIHALGAWVLRTACAEAAGWPDLSIAVNVSPLQFSRGDLAELVQQVLEETGLEPRRLELEITEGVLLHDTKAAAATLSALKALGVQVAMDDFGTGYSSLGYVQRFPFDKIKIDRSFTSKLGESPEAAAIVRAVVSLGRSLGIRIIAEGVETEGQAAFLSTEGCMLAQGYLFGRPAPAEAIDRLLEAEELRMALRA